jgi:hypothetical protein
MHLSPRLARQVGESSRSFGRPREKVLRKLSAHTLIERNCVGKWSHYLPGGFERHDLYTVGTDRHANRIGNSGHRNSFFRNDIKDPPGAPAFSIVQCRRPARRRSGAPSRSTCRRSRRHRREPWPAVARPRQPLARPQAPKLSSPPRDAMRRGMAG